MSSLTRQSAQLTATCKTFNTRDAATAFLRKQGIDKARYNDFISNYRGKMTIDTQQVDTFIHPVAPAATEKPTRVKPETAAVPAPPTEAPKPTRVKPVEQLKVKAYPG